MAQAILPIVTDLTSVQPQDSYFIASLKFASGPLLKVTVAALAALEFVAYTFLLAPALLLAGFDKKIVIEIFQQWKSAAKTIIDAIAALATTHAAEKKSDPSTSDTPRTDDDLLKSMIAFAKESALYSVAKKYPDLTAAVAVTVALSAQYYFGTPGSTLPGIQWLEGVLNNLSMSQTIALLVISGFFVEAPALAIGNLAVGMCVAFPSYFFLPPANTVLPIWIGQLAFTIFTKPIMQSREFLVSILPRLEKKSVVSEEVLNYVELLTGAALEEMVYRGIIQSIVLRKVPKLVLKKIAPKHHHLVDHKISKVARSIMTSLLFAFGHSGFWGSRGMLAPQFVAGLAYSYWRENRMSLTKLSTIHFLKNAMIGDLTIWLEARRSLQVT